MYKIVIKGDRRDEVKIRIGGVLKPFFISVFVLIVFCIGSQVQAEQDPLQELYKAAKAEGKVFYWGPSDPEELGPVVKAFKKKYPGIEFQQFEIRSDDFVPRTIAEANQGRISYDVGEGRISTFFPLLDLLALYPLRLH